MAGGKGKLKPEDNPKPFVKGAKPGPGYPKGVPNTKTRLKRLLEIITNNTNPFSKQKEDMSVAEQMDISIIVKAMKGDVAAYNAILDRLEGKVKQDIGIEEKITKIKVGFTGGATD